VRKKKGGEGSEKERPRCLWRILEEEINFKRFRKSEGQEGGKVALVPSLPKRIYITPEGKKGKGEEDTMTKPSPQNEFISLSQRKMKGERCMVEYPRLIRERKKGGQNESGSAQVFCHL